MNIYSNVDLTSTVRRSEKRKGVVCRGMACVGDGKLVIVTKNGLIVILNDEGVNLYSCDTYYNFEDVTVVSEYEIATSGEYFIKFFNISGDKVSELTDREVDYSYCGGPTIHGISSDGAIVVTSCNVQMMQADTKPFLRMFTLEGQLIRDIRLTGVEAPTRIALSSKDETIFLLDQRQNSLVCLKWNGKEKWTAFASNFQTDFVLLPNNTLAVVAETSGEVSYFDAHSGKSVHANSKIPFMPANSNDGFVLSCNKGGKMFTCPIENESIDTLNIRAISEFCHKKSNFQKLKKLLRM